MKDAGGTAEAATVARPPQSPHLPEREATTTIVFSLLRALTASDNDARNRAEQAFNTLKESSPAALLYGLLQVSAAGVSPCMSLWVFVLSLAWSNALPIVK